VAEDERRRLLERIIGAGPSLGDDVRALRALPFDVDEPVVVLTVAQACAVLARHAAGALSDAELELWADALEIRDDVGLEQELLRECLFELSSPELSDRPMAGLVEGWRARLGCGHG
jgi:hypothetical protein